MKNTNKIFFITLIVSYQLINGLGHSVKALPTKESKSFNVNLNNFNSLPQTKEKYVEMDYVSGANIDLFLDTRDLIINFQDNQPSSIRLRMDASPFFKNKKDYPSSFKVEAYEIDNLGNKKFLSSARPTVYNRPYARNLNFDIGVGFFTTDHKTVYLAIYDSNDKLYTTLKKEIQARNITAQDASEELTVAPAECTSGKLDDCSLKYILNNIKFQAIPRRYIKTEVRKQPDGTYLVEIPLAKRKVKFKQGSNVINEDVNLADSNGNEYETRLDLGVSDSLKTVLNYDPVKKNFGIAFGTNETDKLTFTEEGRLGIGLENPSAYLHLTKGDALTPSMLLDAGSLLAIPKDGAVEFDGDNLFFTVDGIRGKVITTKDVNGKLTGGEVNEDFVLIDKKQIVRNKTLNETTFTGSIKIPENAAAQKVLVSTGNNGDASWSFIKKLGLTAETTGNESLAVGNFVNSSGDYSVVIGSGANDSNRLTNTSPKSLVVGFNGDVASMFVGPGDGIQAGNIGVGTRNPQALLDVNGTLLADSISSVNIAGDGAGLTNLNASAITHGMLDPEFGGTGINNLGGTLSFGANDISFTGADINFNAVGLTNLNLPTTGTLSTLAGVETLSNKTFSNTATFSDSLIINDGTQADGYVLVSDSAGRAGWEDFSSAIENANVSMDMLKDIISDIKNGNIMVGNGSGIALNGGKFNTALGIDSLKNQATGNGNIAIGYQAGDNLTSGSNNITIGYDTEVVNSTGSNQLNIGNTIFGDINLKRVGIGALSPQTRFQIGDGTADFISGPDSLYVKDDIEADGNIYANSLSVTNSLSAGGLITGNDLSISNDATFSKFTQGSVPFFGAGGALSEANSSLFYDSTNARVGIGTNTPASKLDVNGTIRIRGGTPAENFVLTATNTDGDSTWRSVSSILTDGGAFLNALNDAISDKTSNLFLGNGSGLTNSGEFNTGVGIHALGDLASGNSNTALGYRAGKADTSGDYNVAIGSETLLGNDSGNGNIAIGYQAGLETNGDNNLTLGFKSGNSISTGDNNITLGYQAGSTITTGSNNIVIGHNISAVSPSGNNQLNLGNAIFGNLSNQRISIGNATSSPSASLTVGNATITSGIDGNNDIAVAGDAEIDGNVFVDGNFRASQGVTFSNFTQGSIPFFGASGALSQSNANLFWDNTNNRFLLGGTSIANSDINLGVDGSAVFNEQASNADFRVEGQTDPNLLFIDASASNVGIGTGAPSNFKLQVAGNIGPNTTSTQDLGSNAVKWRKVFVDTVNATTLNASNLNSSFTAGSVIFSGSSGSLNQDNNKLFWDDSSDKLGIGTSTPSAGLSVGAGSNSNANSASDIYVANNAEIDGAIFVSTKAIVAGPINGTTLNSSTINNSGTTNTAKLLASDSVNGLNLTINNRASVGSLISSGTVNGSNAVLTNATIGTAGITNATIGTANITNLNSTSITNANSINTGKLIASNNVNGATGNFGAINIPSMTAGSVAFFSTGGTVSQKNSSLFWDNTSNRLGIGTNAPSTDLDVTGTLRMRGASPTINKIMTSSDGLGTATWSDLSTILTSTNTSITDLADAFSDRTTNFNLFVGDSAGTDATPGKNNTAIGVQALDIINSSSSNGNTAIGARAGLNHTSGNFNTALGASSLSNNTGGHKNVALGHSAGAGLIAGTGNIFLGFQTGTSLVTGNNNIVIGNGTDLSNGTNNQLNIADSITGNTSTKRIAIGFTTATPNATLQIGSASLNRMSTSGGADVLVEDDLEVLGTSFATNFNGASMNLTGTASVNKLIATLNLNGATLNTTGTATVNKLLSNNNINGSILNLTGAANITGTATAGKFITAHNINGANLFLSSMNTGSIPFFTGSQLTQNNSKLFWDNTNSRLGVGTSSLTSPNSALTIQPSINTDVGLTIKGLSGQTGDFVRVATFGSGDIFRINGSENLIFNKTATFNNGSAALADFRIKSQTDSNMFFVDSDQNKIGIRTSSPTADLDINGSLRIRNGTLGKYKVLASSDALGTADWMDISKIITNGGTFIDALNDAISDKNSNLYLGNGAGLTASTGKNNTGIGILALGGITTGNGNTALGFRAGNPNTIGDFNTAIGVRALNSNYTGNGNIAIGYQAGQNLNTGDNNIFIGFSAQAMNDTASNQLNIADTITGNTNSKRIAIGFSTASPAATLEVGDATRTHSDGNNDLLVADDLEVVGTAFASNFNGASLNLSGTASANKVIASSNINGASLNINNNVVVSSTGNVAIGKTSTSAKLEVNGALALSPSNVVSLGAGDTLTVTNSIMKVQGSGTPVILNSDPQIAPGVNGQIVVIKGDHATRTVEFQDGLGLALNGDFTLGLNDTLVLIYDSASSLWIEITRSDN